jgi:predicted transposase YdaD
MVLTTLEREQSVEEAKHLLSRSGGETESETERRGLMEAVTTIMVYRYAELSRVEVEAMLNIRLEETRVYREAKEEGRQEGRQEGQQIEAANLVVRQLTRRLGQSLPTEISATIAVLPLLVLEELGEALLEFSTLAALEAWLAEHQ